MFFVFTKSKKNMPLLNLVRKIPMKSVLSRALKVTVWKVTKSLFKELKLIILHEITLILIECIQNLYEKYQKVF